VAEWIEQLRPRREIAEAAVAGRDSAQRGTETVHVAEDDLAVAARDRERMHGEAVRIEVQRRPPAAERGLDAGRVDAEADDGVGGERREPRLDLAGEPQAAPLRLQLSHRILQPGHDG